MQRGHIDVGIGFCDVEDALEAGKEAAQKSISKVVGEDIQFALVFMTTSYNHAQVIEGVRSVLSCDVAGVSSCHIISKDKVYDHGVSVILIQSEDVHFSAVANRLDPKIDVRRQMSYATTQLIDGNIGKMFTTAVVKVGKTFVQISPYTLFLLGNVSHGMDGCQMLRGVLDVSGGIFQIAGGAPGNPLDEGKAIHSFNGKVYDCGALLLLLASKVPTGVGIANAWRPIGGAHVVTKAEGNVVYEIDHLKASRMYENYLSKPLEFLRSTDFARLGFLHPMGVLLSYGDALIRNPHTVNEDGSMIFNGSIREGCAIRFMTCSRDEVVEAVKKSTREATSSLGKAKPAIVFAFISVVDTMLLGKNINKEVQAIQSIVGTDVPVVGIFTLGEYSRESVYAHKFYSNSVSIFIIGH